MVELVSAICAAKIMHMLACHPDKIIRKKEIRMYVNEGLQISDNLFNKVLRELVKRKLIFRRSSLQSMREAFFEMNKGPI